MSRRKARETYRCGVYEKGLRQKAQGLWVKQSVIGLNPPASLYDS